MLNGKPVFPKCRRNFVPLGLNVIKVYSRVTCETGGSEGGEHADAVLLGCNSVDCRKITDVSEKYISHLHSGTVQKDKIERTTYDAVFSHRLTEKYINLFRSIRFSHNNF